MREPSWYRPKVKAALSSAPELKMPLKKLETTE